jgi:ribosome production factor 1
MKFVEDNSKITEFEIFDKKIFNFDWTSITSKVFITTSEKPSSNTHLFASCLNTIIPNSSYVKWNLRPKLSDLYNELKGENYTHSIILFENQKKIQYFTLLFLFLESPLYFTFKFSSLVLPKHIHKHGKPTESHPELIINNFTSKAGVKIAKLLSSLFPSTPDFLGRQALTLHNQRDYIFVRYHRYIFDEFGKKASIQELGPRFSLKLYYISDQLNFVNSLWSIKDIKRVKKSLNRSSNFSMDNKVYLL